MAATEAAVFFQQIGAKRKNIFGAYIRNYCKEKQNFVKLWYSVF